MKRSLSFLLLLAAALPGRAQTERIGPAETTPAAPVQTETATQDATEVRIDKGDLVTFEVFGLPELRGDMRVSSSGGVWLPLVGVVAVAGLTVEEARQAIASKYVAGGYLVNPAVSVFVKEYATQGISVLGEVGKPGIYPLLGERRLYDALAAAGGLTNKAGKVATVTRRRHPDQPIVVRLSNDPGEVAASNVAIFPGDTVVVTRAAIVYVVGEVRRPGGFTVDSNTTMTVLQALALAEGLGKNPSLNSARIVRRTPQGIQEVPVPLKNVLAAKEPDIPLQPDDVLFIPTSAGKAAAKRSLEAIVQMVVGIAIFNR